MESATDTLFGLKEHGDLFRAALKLASRGGGLLMAKMRREVDGMTIVATLAEAAPQGRRKRGRRRKKPVTTLAVMILERSRVVFDATASWKKGGRKRGRTRTFHDGLWSRRLMRAARGEDYLNAVSAELFRKALALLSEQVEPAAALPTEAARSATDVVHRRFEPVRIEVRAYGLPDATKTVRHRIVKVLHEDREVYEAAYALDHAAAPPDRPKLTLQMDFGAWRETLQSL